jgi:hypothetical protein
MAAHGPETPLSYHDAVRSPQANQWHKAMQEEYNMLMEQGTWVLEDLPNGCKAIGCCWTFMIKFGPNREILQFKAYLVMQGFLGLSTVHCIDGLTMAVTIPSGL